MGTTIAIVILSAAIGATISFFCLFIYGMKVLKKQEADRIIQQQLDEVQEYQDWVQDELCDLEDFDTKLVINGDNKLLCVDNESNATFYVVGIASYSDQASTKNNHTIEIEQDPEERIFFVGPDINTEG